MRKEIRELLQGQLSQAKGRVDRLAALLKNSEAELATVRIEHNAAENLVRLIEEELQRPDGSPASENGGRVDTQIAGSGI